MSSVVTALLRPGLPLNIDFTRIPQLAGNIARLVEITAVLVKFGIADWLGRMDSHFIGRFVRRERATLGGFELVAPDPSTHESGDQPTRRTRLPSDTAILFELDDGALHRVAESRLHVHAELRTELHPL